MIRMRELRKAKGLTQSKLGEILGVSASTIGMYEQGRRDPDTQLLANAAKFFNVTVDYLLGKEITDNKITVSAQEFLRLLLKDNPQALEVLNRMKINANGEIDITGIDLASQAVINHQLRGLISALKEAKITDGNAHVEWKPKLK